ncbi:MAG: GAF domain-containing sensor histidine kinase [Dehalococcoidia bacterium]|nr:GAF domain-containing sensor histidine kinase [Dehalococcoidia bacterium]
MISALDKTLEIINKSIGGILLLDEAQQMLNYAAHRGMSETYVRKVRCRLGEGVAGLVAKTGEAIVLDDALADPRLAYRDLVTAEGLRAFASIPLISKGKVLGVLNIASHEIFHFHAEDIQLLNSIAAQVAIAVENAKLHQEVQRQDAIRGELLRDIYLVQEEERRRIARELHDETCQTLTSLSTSLETTIRKLPAGSDGTRGTLRKCQTVSDGILEGIHRLIYELRPTLLDDLGLAAATRWLVDTILKPAGVKASFAVTGRERRLDSELETTLFRVMQEAMRNIARHAGAENAEISLHFGKKALEAYVTDDGSGFDVESAIRSKNRPRGLGLLGMKERVELVGGTLTIASDKDGTRIFIRLPVRQEVGDAKDKTTDSG